LICDEIVLIAEMQSLLKKI